MEDEAGEDRNDWVDGDPVLVVDGEEVHEGGDVAADDANHVHRQPRHQQVGGLTVNICMIMNLQGHSVRMISVRGL